MASKDVTHINNLTWRRQFVLCPGAHEVVVGWPSHAVSRGMNVFVHPDLPFVRVDSGERSLLLLGYVLDPQNPDRDELTILTNVLHATTTFAETLKEFDRLAGRWAILYLEGDRVLAFNDAAGMRPLYHYRDARGTVWMGSSARLLSQTCGAADDVVNRQRLVHDGAMKTHRNHFWPGDGTGYLGVKRMLPNHYLDVGSGVTYRYWPNAPIEHVSLDDAVDRCAETLKGVVDAAAARYRLSLAVTAGVDSRVLLAASKGQTSRMTFYTLNKTNMSNRSADIRVPRKMLKDLGLPHKLIPVQLESSGPVADAIHAIFSPVHQSTLDQAVALASNPPRSDGSWVTLNGNVSEVARYPEFTMGFKAMEVTPTNLALNAGFGNSEFASAQFGSWYEDARPALETSGVDTWDLFYWEQKIGAWLSTVRTEFDTVEESVTPYNSRSLLECMLGVDASLRCAPDYVFHRRLIAHMWPAVLDHPINPPPRSAQLRALARAAIRRFKSG